MSINRQNYESILVDYLDGKLSKKDEAELMLFLLKNPDIAEEFDGVKEVSINPNNTYFPNKNLLKKSNFQGLGINNEIDYLCIADLEGDINSNEKEKLNEQIENDESIRRIQTIFSNTKLTVPHEIVYPHKSNLKRLQVIPIRRTTYRIAMGVAATVAITLAIYTTIDLNTPLSIIPKEEISLNTPQKDKYEQTTTQPTESVKINSTQGLTVKKTSTNINPQKGKKQESNADQKQETIIASIEPLPARLEQIAQIGSTKLEIPKTSSSLNQRIELQDAEKIQYAGSTKEYSLSDLAQAGLKRIANSLGVEYNVKKNHNGKIEKLSIESNLLAFSTTRGEKNE